MGAIKFEIITPLIISGADNREVELREQSLKGILRWWFRFYKGSRLNIEQLKDIEGKIWGSQSLASRIKIIIKDKNNLTTQINGQDYYAYLCMNDSRRRVNGARRDYVNIKRRAFVENQKFEVNFRFIYPLENSINYENELNQTLFFLSNFGGLGARWRRGFGSIMIDDENLQNKNNIDDIADYLKQKLREFQTSSQNRNKDFMNLSNTSIFLVAPQSNNFWQSWEDSMNDLRDEFYRNLKNYLEINQIAVGSPRKVSPLIIQIKKVNSGYYGVILVWKEWDKYNDFFNFKQNIENNYFKIREVLL